MDLYDHGRAIWRHRWRVLLLSLAVAAVVFARSRSLDEVFSAEAQLQVDPAGSAVDVSSDEAEFLATTYTELLDSNAIAAAAAEASGLELDALEAEDRLSATTSATPGFLTVSATGPTAEAAEALAQAGAQALATSVTAAAKARLADQLAPVDAQLEDLLTALRASAPGSVERDVLQVQYQSALARRTELATEGTDALRVVDDATAGSSPIAPTPTRDALLALIVALIVNAELAVVLEAFSGRLSGADDELVRLTGLPVLARIPDADESETVEALRMLRTSLFFLESAGDVRCLAVVGADAGVGTTFVATGLAATTAGLDLPVVLVDGDLRAPGVGRVFGTPDRPGLGDLAVRDDPMALLVTPPGHPFLRILPAGTGPDDPAGLLSGRFRGVIDHLADAMLIVVDTPPARAFAETAAVAAQCDLCVVVIDRDSARRKDVTELVGSLRRVGANPVGIVLNREPSEVAPPRADRGRR